MTEKNETSKPAEKKEQKRKKPVFVLPSGTLADRQILEEAFEIIDYQESPKKK